MKRFLLAASVFALMVGVVALSGGAMLAPQGEMQIDVATRNPWTNLKINNAPDTFHFVVVSDRTGGHRARVFSQAVEQINLLQPAFVLSVGDLIEGYTKDVGRLNEEWKEMQTYASKFKMPFFYVAGNHDLSNAVQVADWKQRFGRSYYHFLYRDVLFLCLATDDLGEDKDYGQISMEQVEYVKKVLADNSKVRWTIVSLHKPVWGMQKTENNNFSLIEKELAGRKYTVFAGHLHRYQKYVRQGMNYYQLATTGGGSKMRGLEYREFDHIAWVTMTKDGPVLANIMLDGILPEDLKRNITDEEGVIPYNRKPVQAARGKVFMDGAPMAGAKIMLNAVDANKEKSAIVSDAYADADGSFVLSSYRANDGAPVGDYVVTVTWRNRFPDDKGDSGPNRAPEKYASFKTSDLKASIKLGGNELNLELAK